MTWLTLACTAGAVGVLVLAALHDLGVRTVPNALVLALTGIGVLLALAEHRLGVTIAVAAGVLGFGLLLGARGLLGGGDVKLLAACALVLDPWQVPPALLATALAGGLLAIPYLPGRRLFARPAFGRPTGTLPRLLRCERWRLSRRGPLPYAVAIAAGFSFVLLHKG